MRILMKKNYGAKEECEQHSDKRDVSFERILI